MNLDLGPAFTPAQAVVSGLVAAIPGLVALVVFGGFRLVAAIVRSVKARLTEARLSPGRALRGLLPSSVPLLLMDVAPSAVTLRVRWWIASPKGADALDARDKVLSAIRNRLTSYGIDLPFPNHQILFHDHTEDSDGDRARQREGWAAGHTDVPPSRKVADAIRQLSGSRPRVAE